MYLSQTVGKALGVMPMSLANSVQTGGVFLIILRKCSYLTSTLEAQQINHGFLPCKHFDWYSWVPWLCWCRSAPNQVPSCGVCLQKMNCACYQTHLSVVLVIFIMSSKQIVVYTNVTRMWKDISIYVTEYFLICLIKASH